MRVEERDETMAALGIVVLVFLGLAFFMMARIAENG
jgi:hypothetical protein